MMRGAIPVGRPSICTEICDDPEWFVIGLFGKPACYKLTAPDQPISIVRAGKASPLEKLPCVALIFHDTAARDT